MHVKALLLAPNGQLGHDLVRAPCGVRGAVST